MCIPMRLLNVHTLEFSIFHSNAPRYAIASHRWNAGDEAMLEDVKYRRNTDKSGYQKVKALARYVTDQISHIEWLWVDTCCVNQDSSQEVSEAVNSMFSWYLNAEVCLAYLADVDSTTDEHEFRRSEWFRRGWTLQEVLAPHVVVFLSRNWEVIGHKGGAGWTKSGFQVSKKPSLETAIATTTGIPECVLENYGRSRSFSVEERMAWIDGRETTRGEDMSYSLLGMFDLRMSIDYGEGADSARDRLLRKISKASIPGRDHVAEMDNERQGWGKAVQASHNIPFLQDQHFVNRADLMDCIHKKLARPTGRAALVGLGGVGKSQLAIEYAYRLRKRSPGTWAFWMHASSQGRFEQSARDVADLVNLPKREERNADVFQLLRNWLRDKGHGKWVIILDNADDVGFLVNSVAVHDAAKAYSTLFACLPVCDHGSILITSRNSNAARQLVVDINIIDVGPMWEEESVILLRKSLSEHATETALTQLATALEHMPLAIAQAAAYIKQRTPRCSVQQYVSELQKSDKSKMSLLNRDEGSLRRDKEASNSIMLTWQISFEYIRQRRPSAADLLSLMSFFDRQAIPESLLKDRSEAHDVEGDVEMANNPTDKGYERESDSSSENADKSSITTLDSEFEEDVRLLRDYSFIAITSDVAIFGMHRLVQLATQRWLEAHGQLGQWQRQFVISLNTAFPYGRYENWGVCQTLYPHVKLAQKLKCKELGESLAWAALMHSAAWYTLVRGSARDAEAMALIAMEVRAQELGQDHEDTLRSIGIVASTYRNQGQWDKAKKLDVQVIETRKRVLGEEHPDTLMSIYVLAFTYFSQGQWDKAEELYMQVTETRKRVLGEEHPDTLTSIYSLALTYSSQGQWDKAEELGVQAIETRKRVLGEEHPHTLMSIHDLALTYSSQGQWDKAEELGVQATETRKRVLGEEHPYALTSIHGLALMYSSQGQWDKAEELGVQVIETRKRVLGEEHPHTLMSMHGLALMYSSQGQWDTAEELYVQVTETRKRVLGEEHPHTLISMQNLARTKRAKGDDHLSLRVPALPCRSES